MHLIAWKASRAGGRITVTGTDAETRKAVKIVGVDVIEPAYNRTDCVLATDKNGGVHELRVPA